MNEMNKSDTNGDMTVVSSNYFPFSPPDAPFGVNRLGRRQHNEEWLHVPANSRDPCVDLRSIPGASGDTRRRATKAHLRPQQHANQHPKPIPRSSSWDPFGTLQATTTDVTRRATN